MKRTVIMIVLVVVAVAIFAGLVYGVLVAAHVAEPADATIYGLTARRLWATLVAMLAFIGVLVGAVALARPGSRVATVSGVMLTIGLGLVGIVNGVLNLAVATGGPGTGNGVVGGAAAVVLGLIAVAMGGLALARRRQTPLSSGQMT